MTMLNREHNRPIRILVFFSLLVLLTFQFPIQSVLAQEDLGEIVVGVPTNFPPQYYIDEETGEPYGFAIDVMDEIAARSGLTIRYVIFDTCAESLTAIQEGKIDVIPNVGVIAEREDYLDYTTSIEVFNIGIIVRSSTMDIQNIDDLSGRHVAVVSKDKGHIFLEEHEEMDLHPFSGIEEALFSLISGETDACVYPTEQVVRIAIRSDIEDHIKVVGEPLVEVKRAIAVREGQTKLLNILDREVKAFVATPEYREMYSKWYGEPEPYWNAERVATMMGSILVLVVILLVSWHYLSVLRLNQSLKSSISERKRTEGALIESEERYRTLFENTMVGIGLGKDNRVISANRAILDIFGYESLEEFAKVPIIDHVVPEYKDIINEMRKKQDHGKTESQKLEYQIIRKNGEIRDLEGIFTPIALAGERYSLNSFIDITDRNQAKEAFNKSYEMFSTIMDSLNAIVYVADMDTYEILFLNKFSKGIFGDSVGKKCWNVFQANQSKPCDFCTNDKLVNANGEPVGVCAWEHLNEVNGRWYSLIDRAIRWVDGRIVRLEIAIDITDRKKSEEMLQKEKDRSQNYLNISGVVMVVIDDEQKVTLINKKGAEILGYNEEEIIGKNWFETFIPTNIKDDVKAVYMEIIAGDVEPVEYFENPILNKNGEERIIAWHNSILRDAEDNIIGTLSSGEDITERKRTEEKLEKYTKELARTNEELKSLDKMRDEFLSNVSHELKTPLVSIRGFSELMGDEVLGALNESQKKAADTVVRNSNRLERLIDSVLYLSIAESGRMKYTFKPLQIADIIENSVLDMRPQVKKNNLKIKKEVPDNLPLIQGDEDRLTQVMINLIGNANKFTSSGEITITAHEDGDELHITVNDTGIGIPPEQIDNLFERFYQVDGSTKRKYGGTGLGLHISKLIVEAHKGKIWAESEEGVGTTIHFTLPK